MEINGLKRTLLVELQAGYRHIVLKFLFDGQNGDPLQFSGIQRFAQIFWFELTEGNVNGLPVGSGFKNPEQGFNFL